MQDKNIAACHKLLLYGLEQIEVLNTLRRQGQTDDSPVMNAAFGRLQGVTVALYHLGDSESVRILEHHFTLFKGKTKVVPLIPFHIYS